MRLNTCMESEETNGEETLKKKRRDNKKKSGLVQGIVEVAFVVGFPGYPYFF
jgi:hypothetical protein